MATAAFTTFTTRGGGTLRFRLMVEGWPYEWVTSPAITHADNADGRTVVIGLKHDGLQVHDRIVMQEAALEADGMTFRIAPTKRVRGKADNATLMFSLYPTPVAQLQVSIDEDDDEFPSVAFVGDVELDNDTVYHMGTEALRVGEYPEITRHIWDTQPQAHRTSYFNAAQAVYVYEHPPTMDGRRCYLYGYADGEDVDGDGQILWRGIITGPPKLDSDGLTWVLEAQAITHVLKQSVAGGIETARIIGIYHHAWCAFALMFDDWLGTSATRYVTGLHTEASLIVAVNSAISSALVELGLDDDFDSFVLEKANATTFRFRARVPGAISSFGFAAGSPLLGTVFTADTRWTNAAGYTRSGIGDDFLTESDWYVDLVPNRQPGAEPGKRFATSGIAPFSFGGSPAAAIGPASDTMVNDAFYGYETFVDRTAVATQPVNRIWVDKDLTGAVAVHIPDTLKKGNIYTIESAGNVDGYHYIDIVLEHSPFTPRIGTPEWLRSRGFGGFLTGETEINVVRDYGHVTSVLGFVAALKEQSVDANLGDTPLVTEEDLSLWQFGSESVWTVSQTARVYRFIKQLGLDQILPEELKLAGHFPRIDADGKISIQPLPNFTDAEIVGATHTITPSTIITPADDYGAWPAWEPQRDGLVTMVEIQQRYDPIEDKWIDAPQVFQDAHAIALHKNRGKSRMSIKPYSALAVDYVHDIETLSVRFVADMYLGTFARDYATVTLQLSFKHFGILCGDVVSLTHPLIPDGLGNRGVIGRRAVCIERRWNLDASVNSFGTLTFLMSSVSAHGYAPAVVISAQADQGGNVWNLTCSTAHAINIAISGNGDGRCLEHFANGDYIRVVRKNSTTGTQVTGTITGTPNAAAGTCTITLDATWTPSSFGWVLEPQVDTDGSRSTANQRQFTYIADATLHTGPDSFAERFA